MEAAGEAGGSTGSGGGDAASWASDDFGQALPPGTSMLLEGIIDAVVVANQVGRIVFANAAAERMFGYGKVRVPPSVSSFRTALLCAVPHLTLTRAVGRAT
jgi:hypothetical protein